MRRQTDSRPDSGRSEVRDHIKNNTIMWLSEYNLGGLRMDMIPYIRNIKADGNPANDLPDGYSMIAEINKTISEIYPRKKTIAEDMHSLESITLNTKNGGLGYGSQWDAEFVHPVRKTPIKQDDIDHDMNAVASTLLHRYNHAFERIVYTESHDEVANR
jgi:1,4-alpha-glucan branching enzyme